MRLNDADVEAKGDSIHTTESESPKEAPEGACTGSNGNGEDEDEIFWDGPTDPANPMNWSTWKKSINIAIISAMTFLTPLASSMFAPGVPEVMKQFQSNR